MAAHRSVTNGGALSFLVDHPDVFVGVGQCKGRGVRQIGRIKQDRNQDCSHIWCRHTSACNCIHQRDIIDSAK